MKKNFSRFLPYLLGVLVLVVIAIIIGARFSVKSTPSQTAGLAKISDLKIASPQLAGQKIFFLDESRKNLQSLDLKSQKSQVLFPTPGSIVSYQILTNSTSIFIQTNTQDVFQNWVYSLDSNKTQKAKDCISSVAQVTDGVVYNCFSQKSDYDPDFTNTLVAAKDALSDGPASANLPIDQPKKVLGQIGDNTYLLSDSPGYQSNDVLTYNKTSGKIAKATNSGTVSNALLAQKSNTLIYESTDKTPHITILNLLTNDKNELDFVSILDRSALSSDGKSFYLVAYNGTKNKDVIYRFDLQTGKSKMIEPSPPPKQIQSILPSEDGKILYIATDEGLFSLSI